MQIEARTIDGRVWLAADDVANGLRSRAEDYTTSEAAAAGGPLQHDARDVHLTVAEELRQRADWIDIAAVSYLSTV